MILFSNRIPAIFIFMLPSCKYAWWCQMETFSASRALCEGNSTVTCWFLAQRPLARSFDVSFDLRLNKRLSKQSTRQWFETQTFTLWLISNGSFSTSSVPVQIFQTENKKKSLMIYDCLSNYAPHILRGVITGPCTALISTFGTPLLKWIPRDLLCGRTQAIYNEFRA